MAAVGYALSSEEHGPRALVRNARRAEDLGLDFVAISDHYHPWLDVQGNSPFVWAVLGGIAATTERIAVGTGVTAPVIRIHPAVVAQAAATVATMMPGRFFLGVGSGEALNEHVTGAHWPEPDVRLEMLEEAVDVMRQLWAGGLVSHRGRHYTVENARLYTLPPQPPAVVVSGAGSKAVALAARIGDGYWGIGPKADNVREYRHASGTGPAYAQVTCCWAEDDAAGRKTAYQMWPTAGLRGQLAQELALPSLYEAACAVLTEEQVTEHLPIGPDPEPYVEAFRKYTGAGFDHVYFHQIGPDQDGFLDFVARDLLPLLREAADHP